MVRQLLDVVDEAEELPLPVDLRSTAQREAVEPFVVAEIAEHRFHGAEAPAVLLAPSGESIRCFIRAVCVSGSGAVLPRKNMTERTAVVAGVRETPRAQRDRGRSRAACPESASRCCPDSPTLAVAIQRLARRADARARLGVIRESRSA